LKLHLFLIHNIYININNM